VSVINTTVRLARRVTVNAQRQFVIVELVDQPWFRAIVTAPSGDRPNTDQSPRDQDPRTMRWLRGRTSAVEALRGGYRVETRSGELLELLDAPRELQEGLRPVWQASVQRVDVLYPYVASLREQGGAVIKDVAVALFSPDETHGETGSYENLGGQASIEHAADLRRNRNLVLGTEKLNIISATTYISGPRVELSLRRPGG
jgi:hypothetical protein